MYLTSRLSIIYAVMDRPTPTDGGFQVSLKDVDFMSLTVKGPIGVDGTAVKYQVS